MTNDQLYKQIMERVSVSIKNILNESEYTSFDFNKQRETKDVEFSDDFEDVSKDAEEHLKNGELYIRRKNNMQQLDEVIKFFCSNNSSAKIKINEDGDIDVKGNINYFTDCPFVQDGHLTIQFGTVDGNFCCPTGMNDEKMVDLEGCPQTVKGIFNCSATVATKPDGGPTLVSSYYYSGDILAVDVANYCNVECGANNIITNTRFNSILNSVKVKDITV